MTLSRSGLDWVRDKEFAGLEDAAYLNAAALGPLPTRTRNALASFAERRHRVHAMADEDFSGPPARARELAARLLGADQDEVALAPNTSFGLNLVALGLDVPENATVLVSDAEFPANVYPWMHRPHLELERVPLTTDGWPDEQRMIERIRAGGVSVLSISSVQFHNGYRADLELLGRTCREHGTVFVIDAIQSLGCIPFDVRACHADVVCSGGHKWLCGPFGSGVLYVRREVQARLNPALVGWFSMRAGRRHESVLDYRWEFVPGAERYEVGTQPIQDQLGLAESLSLILEAGPDAIWSRVDRLTRPLREWLRDHPDVELVSCIEPERRSGILSFRTPATAAVYQALKRAGIVCSLREGLIRTAPHFYNTEQDLELMVEALDARASEGWG